MPNPQRPEKNHGFLQRPASTKLLFSLIIESKFPFVHWVNASLKLTACDAVFSHKHKKTSSTKKFKLQVSVGLEVIGGGVVLG